MHDILHRVGITAPDNKVFEAVSTIEGYRAWWDSTAVGDPHKNGTITFFESVDMKVIEYAPDELVKWKCIRGPEDWMNTEITFKLKKEQNETFVLFTHSKWKQPVEFMYHCSTKWAVFMLSLKDYVELGKGLPSPYDLKIHSKG